jgi:hypothetical protein
MLTDHLSRGSEEEFVADVVRTGFWRSDTTEDPYAMRHPNADCRRTLEALAMLPDAADILPAGDTVQSMQEGYGLSPCHFVTTCHFVTLAS